MKKLITILLLLSITAPAFAETFFAVDWSEFCPGAYVNLDPNKWYYLGIKRYWAARKGAFLERLEKCDSQPEAKKDACYASLRELERNATQKFNDEMNTYAIQQMMIRDIFTY